MDKWGCGEGRDLDGLRSPYGPGSLRAPRPPGGVCSDTCTIFYLNFSFNSIVVFTFKKSSF